MKTVRIIGPGVPSKTKEAVAKAISQIVEVEGDSVVTVHIANKFDFNGEFPTAARTILELPYLYKDEDVINDPKLMEDYIQVQTAVKTINAIATKRKVKETDKYYKRKKAERAKKKATAAPEKIAEAKIKAPAEADAKDISIPEK